MAAPTSTRERFAAAARLALAGVAVNAVLAVVKVSVGILGHTYALIADGLESTLDIFTSLVIWGGLQFAARPADDTHPYGHGKAEPLASVAVATFIILAAVGLGIQSVREIITPHHAPAAYTLAVLVAIILVKELLYRRVKSANQDLGSTAVNTEAWHHRADAVTSVAAFVGIAIALLGGPGYEAADDWAALAACGFIAWNGWRLLVPAVNEILDVAPPAEMVAQVRATATAVPGVLEVDHCRVRKMGLDFFVDLHIGVQGELTVREGHSIAHHVKDALRADNPAIVDALVHVEPAPEGTL